jgi:hypothetical protein
MLIMDKHHLSAFNPDNVRRKPESIRNQLTNLRVLGSQDDYRKKVVSLLQRLDPAIDVARLNPQLDQRLLKKIRRARKRIDKLLKKPSLEQAPLYQNLTVIYDILSVSGRVAIEDLCKDPNTEDRELTIYMEEP